MFRKWKCLVAVLTKPRRFKVVFVNRIIALVLVIKARHLAYRRNRIYTVSIKYQLRTADCGLRTADCGLRTADCGLGIKHGLSGLKYKTRTKHYGLGINHGLRYKAKKLEWSQSCSRLSPRATLALLSCCPNFVQWIFFIWELKLSNKKGGAHAPF